MRRFSALGKVTRVYSVYVCILYAYHMVALLPSRATVANRWLVSVSSHCRKVYVCARGVSRLISVPVQRMQISDGR